MAVGPGAEAHDEALQALAVAADASERGLAPRELTSLARDLRGMVSRYRIHCAHRASVALAEGLVELLPVGEPERVPAMLELASGQIGVADRAYRQAQKADALKVELMLPEFRQVVETYERVALEFPEEAGHASLAMGDLADHFLSLAQTAPLPRPVADLRPADAWALRLCEGILEESVSPKSVAKAVAVLTRLSETYERVPGGMVLPSATVTEPIASPSFTTAYDPNRRC